MPGREFLELARELLALATLPRHWRAVVIHAYYALLLECRDAQARWGLPLPPRHNVHAVVRLRFTYASDADLKQLGDTLDRLVQLRNQARQVRGGPQEVRFGIWQRSPGSSARAR